MPTLSSRFQCVLIIALGVATTPAIAAAQLNLAEAFNSYGRVGCTAKDLGSGLVMVDEICSEDPPLGGGGTLLGHAAASFDPRTGKFKSFSQLIADHFTLAQFLPTIDADGNRDFTADYPAPDVVNVSSVVLFSDHFSIRAPSGIRPARTTFTFAFSGSLEAPGLPDGAFSLVSAGGDFFFSGIPTAPDEVFYGGVGANLYSNKGAGLEFFQSSNTAAGATPLTVTYAHPSDSVDGLVTLAGFPTIAGTPYSFTFEFGTSVSIYHSTAARSCFPNVDNGCDAVPPTDVTGTASADFFHTVIFAGYTVFDDAGNDITDSVQLTFDSGLVPGSSDAVVGSPEPGTFALVVSGLAVLATRRRRR